MEQDLPLWVSIQRHGWNGRENVWARANISQLPDDIIPKEDREKIASGEWRYDRNSVEYAIKVRNAIIQLTQQRDPVTKRTLAEIVDDQKARKIGFVDDGVPAYDMDRGAVFNQYADSKRGYMMTPFETAKTIILVKYPELTKSIVF